MLSSQDKVDRVTAILEGDLNLVARLNLAEAFGELIDKAVYSMVSTSAVDWAALTPLQTSPRG